MSNSIRDIKRRITSVSKTKKITSALKLVAAAKFKKHQEMIGQLRQYSDKLYELMANILQRSIELEQKFFTRSEGDSLYIIITSDRGLCGGFNQNIFRKVREVIPPNQDLFLIGGKAVSFYKKGNYKIVGSHRDLSESFDTERIAEITDQIIEMYMNGSYSRVFLLYNAYKSAVTQIITLDEILPIDLDDFNLEDTAQKSDYEYEPGAGSVIEILAKKYLMTKIQRSLLESATAEQGARMTAMDSATDNAEDLVYRLTLTYNRARQNAITTELTEIVAGAEGLK